MRSGACTTFSRMTWAKENSCTRFSDFKQTERQGQPRQRGFLWIRQAGTAPVEKYSCPRRSLVRAKAISYAFPTVFISTEPSGLRSHRCFSEEPQFRLIQADQPRAEKLAARAADRMRWSRADLSLTRPDQVSNSIVFLPGSSPARDFGSWVWRLDRADPALIWEQIPGMSVLHGCGQRPTECSRA